MNPPPVLEPQQHGDRKVPSIAASRTTRIEGLDSIRFVCALWVFFSHCGGIPLVEGADPHHPVGWLVRGIYGAFYCGPAAVIVFFVVSGFCIHFPYRNARSVPVVSFLARRYIRIGIPAAVAMGLATLVGMESLLLHRSSFALGLESIRKVNDRDVAIIWSLVCEMIYYTLYPALFAARRRIGWKPILAGSYVAALGVILLRPDAGSYPDFGHFLNWIVGLPCWLLGCIVAESINTTPNYMVAAKRMWLLRFGVWSASMVALLLRFHSPVGYPWSLTVFGALAAWWLVQELRYHQLASPWRVLEWAGAWSYSIYLAHVLAIPLLARVGLQLDFPMLGPNLNWALRSVLILAFCWGFYLVIERPSHLLARVAGSWLGKQRATSRQVPAAAQV